jgi:DHA3 family macrolide efflux protein-like MFS transporter
VTGRRNIPEVVAPLSAAFLVQAVGIGWIMMIGLLTFAFAVAMILLISIPQPETSAEGRAALGSLWSESLYGFRYIPARPGLLGLQLVFLVVNFAGVFQWALQSPMILARTGQDSRALGIVLSAAGIGSVIGGLVMSAWGGPRRRIHGVLGGMTLECLLGIMLMGLARALPVWALAGFLTMLFVPIVNSSNQAIWQVKVAPDVQGKVFAARRVIAQFSYLLGFIAAGPLADRLFEPGMQAGGGLPRMFGGWLGNHFIPRIIFFCRKKKAFAFKDDIKFSSVNIECMNIPTFFNITLKFRDKPFEIGFWKVIFMYVPCVRFFIWPFLCS